MLSNSMSKSDQQVAEGLEVSGNDGLEVLRDNAPALAIQSHDDYRPQVWESEPVKFAKVEARLHICGVPVLWIGFAMFTLVVGIAIGGGIGAAVCRAEMHSKKPTAALTSSLSTMVTTATAPLATGPVTGGTTNVGNNDGNNNIGNNDTGNNDIGNNDTGNNDIGNNVGGDNNIGVPSNVGAGTSSNVGFENNFGNDKSITNND